MYRVPPVGKADAPKLVLARRRGSQLVATVAAWVALASGCSDTLSSSPPEVRAAPTAPRLQRLRARVVAQYPHDRRSYTQGLVWAPGDVLFESSGGYGESSMSRRQLAADEASVVVPLAADLFGEGLAAVGDRLIQLTWQEGVAIVYRSSDLAELERVRYHGEGWGLTYDGRRLIMSDGTHLLTFRDPSTLAVLGRLEVRKLGAPQDRLNELEWIDGAIYANVYQTDEIVVIDPESGEVTAVIDAAGLLSPQEQRQAEVLNGIAYRASTGSLLLTGKYWPRVFEVEIEP